MKALMTLPAPGSRRKKPRYVLKGVLGILGLFVLWLLVYALNGLAWDYPLAAAAAPPTSPRGAFHVHSTISHDGRGTPEEIARAARAAGLHFVILADHNPITLQPPRYESGVLLVFGQELSTPNGHVVALGTSRALTEAERAGEVLQTVRDLGGYAFLPHPEQKKNPWRDWPAAKATTGLELYSADSMFRDAQRRPLTRFLPAAAAYLTNPVHGLLTVVGAQPEATKRLLDQAATRPYVALCAHDAHGYPAYEAEFKTLALYLPPLSGGPALPPDPIEAERHVVETIARGQAWCAFHGIAAGDGFGIEGASGEDGRTAAPGDLLTVTLPAAVPEGAFLKVFGAGEKEGDWSVRVKGPGAVQVEVWAKVPGIPFDEDAKPWLVPSPFQVTEAPSARGGPDGGVADGGQ